MTEEEIDKLAEAVDGVLPMDIGAEVLPDPDSGALLWFKHPSLPHVYAKYGKITKGKNKGRVMRTWIFNEDGTAYVLNANWATDREINYLTALAKSH